MNSPALKATEVLSLLPPAAPLSEVLFNTRGSRHTNSIRRRETAKENSRFMQCTEYSSSKVRLFPPTKTTLLRG